MAAAPPPPIALSLELTRADRPDDPYAFQFRPQAYLLRGAGGGFSSLELDWSAELVADLAAVRKPGRDPALVQRLGELVRRFLGRSSWPEQEAQILAAAQANQRVLLTIRSAAAELYALPWEFLTIKATGQSLGELPSVLLRYEWPETACTPIAPQHRHGPGRILFAWSAAAGAVPAAEHLTAIAAACKTGHVPFDPRFDVLPEASAGGLVSMLRAAKQEGAGIAVLHLLCHGSAVGSTFGLALTGDSTGDSDDRGVIDAARLRQLLAPFSDMLRLVVLSACDSGNGGVLGNQLGSIAQTLHRAGIAQVVASRYPLSLAGSVRFTEAFYDELLGAPESVEQALLAARRTLALDTQQLDWASLQLYAHGASGTDSRPILFRPYRGLLAFQPEHRRFFFGRDREIAELVADFSALRAQKKPRLLALDGASGTGKSSVLFAGALPQLLLSLGPDSSFLRMRPGSTPDQTLSETLAQRAGSAPVLLIIDQFEELFTHTKDAGRRQSFVRRVWQLATDAESGVSVILTLRSDFVGRCGELVLDDQGLRLDRVIYDEAHRISVAQMSRDQLRAAIEKPAERVGLGLERGLPERLLCDVDSEPGALPLLADTLDLLWQRRDGNLLTQAAYDQLGGIAGALHGRADQLIQSLSFDEQREARRLLVRLGSGLSEPGQGVRLRVSVSSRRPPDSVRRENFERAFQRLVEARLLVLDRDGEEQTVEVAHEALLRKWPRLYEWAREDRQMLMQAETIEAWTREARSSATLFSADRLLYADKVERDFPEALSDAARQLIRDSKKMQALAEERDRFARDSLRMLAVQALEHDPSRQVAILREAESADPTVVPGWLAAALSIMHTNALTIAELCGHTGAVSHCDISADGNSVVTASADKTARLFCTTGKADAITLAGHEAALFCCAFSPDGRFVLTCSEDTTARIWSRNGSTPPRVLGGHKGRVWHSAWSPDGSRVATASADGTARIWSVGSAEKPIVLSGHEDEVFQVAWSLDGKRLATASADGTARVWTVSGREAPIIFSEHEDQVGSVQFDPRGAKVLTTSIDGTARLWSLSGRGAPKVYERPEAGIAFACLSPNGQRLALGTESSEIWLCDAAGRGEFLASPRRESALTSIGFLSDTQLVATFEDGLVLVLSAERTAPPLFLKGHRIRVNSAAFCARRERLVTASIDGTARVWDLARADLLSALVFDPQDTARFLFPSDAKRAPNLAAESPDQRLRATAQPDGSVRIESADGHSAAVVLSGHTDAVRCIRWSPDSKRVVTGGDDWQARVWNSDGSGVPLVLSEHTQPVVLALFTPDGKRVLTADELGVLYIWEENGRGEKLFADRRFQTVALSADCKQVACTIDDQLALVLSLELDPAAIKRRLWRATPICLSVEARERYLREPRELAIRNHLVAYRSSHQTEVATARLG